MDQERALDIEQVTKAMDATRRSLGSTMDELKTRMHENADWRHHVTAHPIPSLLVAAACGLALARALLPVVRLAGVPLLLAPQLVRRAKPSRLAALSAHLSGAAGLASQLAVLPSLVAELRRVVRERAGKHLP